jgi:hypothetical protein
MGRKNQGLRFWFWFALWPQSHSFWFDAAIVRCSVDGRGVQRRIANGNRFLVDRASV